MTNTSTISVEQFLGIVPIDEELENQTVDINAIKAQIKADINAVKTRKPDSYYENLREQEGPAPTRIKYPDPTV